MPATIKILPEHLANKIAAGEVVQRPESVVKELVENSLDAKATAVSLVIKDGGKSFIQVSDNGSGMSVEDAKVAFFRHATSKISSYEDLENIRTFGFRGEALASIAAVARMELKTRQIDSDSGTSVRIDGGEIKEITRIGMNPGTNIVVKNLFFNTPARRNFLKSNNTEFRHVYDAVQRAALSHPEISISCTSNDESLLALKGESLEDRIKNLYGERHFETLVPIHEETDLVSISGFIGKPDFARKSKVDQYLFLNKRFILSRAINHAIYSGYEYLVEKGNFPFFLVYLDLDPRKVDVNVHPSKMEVKFADEQSIYRFVMAVVRKALGQHDIVPSLEIDAGKEGYFSHSSLRHANISRYFGSGNDILSIAGPNKNAAAPIDVNRKNDQEMENISIDIEKLFTRVEKNQSPVAPIDKSAPLEFIHGTGQKEEHEGSPIWQLHNKYILAQIRTGLMIIDQHVAHERILYEKATASFQNSVPASQQLLFPHTLQLTPADYALAQELSIHLLSLGFELKLFGKNTVVLEGVPTDVKAGTEGSIVQDILDEFKNNQHGVKLDARDNLAKSFACKAAIKAGDKMNSTEMRVLIDQLFSTSMPYVCPHGRPVLVKISLHELDKRFMRTS